MKAWAEREERPPMFTKGDTRAVMSVYVNGQSRPALTMNGLGPCSLSFVVCARAREQTEQREFFDGVFGLTALDASRAARSELFDGLATRVCLDDGGVYIAVAADRRTVAEAFGDEIGRASCRERVQLQV